VTGEKQHKVRPWPDPPAPEQKVARVLLPWPPSVNHSHEGAGTSRRRSKATKTYQTRTAWDVRQQLGGIRFGAAPVSLVIFAMPPDARKRDLDNILKVTLDTLTAAGAWDDDSQVDTITILRARPPYSKESGLECTISAIPPPMTDAQLAVFDAQTAELQRKLEGV